MFILFFFTPSQRLVEVSFRYHGLSVFRLKPDFNVENKPLHPGTLQRVVPQSCRTPAFRAPSYMVRSFFLPEYPLESCPPLPILSHKSGESQSRMDGTNVTKSKSETFITTECPDSNSERHKYFKLHLRILQALQISQEESQITCVLPPCRPPICLR